MIGTHLLASRGFKGAWIAPLQAHAEAGPPRGLLAILAGNSSTHDQRTAPSPLAALHRLRSVLAQVATLYTRRDRYPALIEDPGTRVVMVASIDARRR